MPDKVILLVEDNPDDVRLTQRAFQKARVANEVVLPATDGLDAKVTWLGSLRARLLFLVFAAMLPSLGLILYRSSEERRLDIEAAEADVLLITRLAAGQHPAGRWSAGACRRRRTCATGHVGAVA